MATKYSKIGGSKDTMKCSKTWSKNVKKVGNQQSVTGNNNNTMESPALPFYRYVHV